MANASRASPKSRFQASKDTGRRLVSHVPRASAAYLGDAYYFSGG